MWRLLSKNTVGEIWKLLGGHAWNEIITKNDTYLFDAMHGNIFSIGNTSRNITPQVFPYKITNPKNNKYALINKYYIFI